MAKGECNCGTVAFEIKSEITDIFVCHCSICRRATGANGIAVVVVDNKDFEWLKGEESIHRWRKPDHDWQVSFCNNCGSPLPDANDAARMYVPAGLIMQGGEKLKIAHHIWVDSKAEWDIIGDNGKCHRQAFSQ